jgi:hypothetical protein
MKHGALWLLRGQLVKCWPGHWLPHWPSPEVSAERTSDMPLLPDDPTELHSAVIMVILIAGFVGGMALLWWFVLR